MIHKKDDRPVLLCKRLQRLGFGPRRRVRLYGEEFDLISDPVFDERGYGIDGISRKSGTLRHVGIPLSIVQTVEQELRLLEQLVG